MANEPCRGKSGFSVETLKVTAEDCHKLQQNFWNFKIQIAIFFYKEYRIMTFDRISFRYEVLDAQVKLQHFLQSYNFIFVPPVESWKFQIKIQR